MKGSFLLFIILPIASYAIFNKNVKYIPMGYKEKPDCPDIQTKKPSGSKFSVWMFLTSLALTSTIGELY